MTAARTLPAPRTAHPIEHFARTHHRTLERWLTANFRRQLTAEDISDVLSETYRAALETTETLAFESERMSAWAYQVARFRAIAVIRARHGRGTGSSRGESPSRRVVLSLDQLTGADKGLATRDRVLGDAADAGALHELATDSAYVELADSMSDAMRAEEARRVTDALRRLPEDQRNALQYVHVDGLTTRAAAELLGTSKSTFNRLYQRAMQRLQALCAAEQDSDCAQARALMASTAALAPQLLGWRDAHIEGCFSCQVAAGRRVRLLLPILPIITVRHGAVSRLLDRIGSLLSRGGGLPSEAVAAGVTTTAGGGAVAGGSLLGGLGAKAAVCVAAAVTCAAGAVAVPVARHHRSHPPTRSPTPTQTLRRASATLTVASSTPAPASTRSSRTAPISAQHEQAQFLAAAQRERAAAAARARKKAAAERKNASTDSRREFSPEAYGSASTAPAATTAPPVATTAAATTAAAPKPSKPSSKSTSSFTQEFRP